MFVIAKDYASGVNLNSAISGVGSQLRPFEAKGISGIIPSVKINYFEVATLTGGQASKDACRTQCETMFNHGADKVRKG